MVDQQLKYIRNFLAELLGRRVKEKAANELRHAVPTSSLMGPNRIAAASVVLASASKSKPPDAELMRRLIADHTPGPNHEQSPALRDFARDFRDQGTKFELEALELRLPGTEHELWARRSVTVEFKPGRMKYVTGRWPTKVPPEDMKLLPDGILEALTNSDLELGETASRTAKGEPIGAVVGIPFQLRVGRTTTEHWFDVFFYEDPHVPGGLVAEARHFNNDGFGSRGMAVAGLPALYQILGQDVELRFAATWKQAWQLNRGYSNPTMDPFASLKFTDTPSNRWNLDQGMAEYISGRFGKDPESDIGFAPMYSGLTTAQQNHLELLTRFREALGAGSLKPDSWAKPADWPLQPCQPITNEFLNAIRHPDRNNNGLVTFTIADNPDPQRLFRHPLGQYHLM